MDHKHYQNVPKNERRSIIKAVLENKQSIHNVAKQYNVLPSTCKSIIHTYQQEGRIGKKKKRIRKINKVVVTHTIVLNPMEPNKSHIITEATITQIKLPSLKLQVEEQPKQPEQRPNQFLQEWISQYIMEYSVQNKK